MRCQPVDAGTSGWRLRAILLAVVLLMNGNVATETQEVIAPRPTMRIVFDEIKVLGFGGDVGGAPALGCLDEPEGAPRIDRGRIASVSTSGAMI
ncbi:MAG: hypothetical protein GY910_18780 [bacterium]|nr:hypothetical protein [Deltaproteobacteria bacterium]MCP4907025.1 hypothetical protein [bacterium]